MSFSIDMDFVWILKMWARPSKSGRPISIFRSSRPGRESAGSRVKTVVGGREMSLDFVNSKKYVIQFESTKADNHKWVQLKKPFDFQFQL